MRYLSFKYNISNYTNLYWKIQIVSNFLLKLDLSTIERVESINTNYMQIARYRDRSDKSYRFIAKILK